jgi:hypothetical protein
VNIFSQNIISITNLKLILAADVVYDDPLTDSLVEYVRSLLVDAHPDCRALISVDWRINFRLSDLSVAPHARDFLVCCLVKSGLQWSSCFGIADGMDSPNIPITTTKLDDHNRGKSIKIRQDGFLGQMGNEWREKTFELFEIRLPPH